MVEKEYNNEDLITCPYCGYENEDSWEVQISDEDYECGECNEKFILEVEQRTLYSTKRKDCEGNHDMKFKLAYIIYDDTNYKTNKIILRERKDFEFTESFECENCCENEWKKMSEDKFKQKYPEQYESCRNRYNRQIEFKELLAKSKNEVKKE
jgi:hypothetical protein